MAPRGQRGSGCAEPTFERGVRSWTETCDISTLKQTSKTFNFINCFVESLTNTGAGRGTHAQTFASVCGCLCSFVSMGCVCVAPRQEGAYFISCQETQLNALK